MSRLRPKILEAKARLAIGCQELQRSHQEGASGVDLCRAASNLRDEVILKLLGDASADRSVCPPEEAETLEFLVGKHLIMNHLAFRRDTSDEQVLVRFAVDVGSPERLRMLFVMTAADLGGVGPGVWDSWKEDVLTDLYRRANRHLPRPDRRRVLRDGRCRQEDRNRDPHPANPRAAVGRDPLGRGALKGAGPAARKAGQRIFASGSSCLTP